MKANFTLKELSGFRLMWLFVFFDLPVVEKEERKSATDFRNALLDEGFTMCQFSVYSKAISGKDSVPRYVNYIKQNLPKHGKVDIICITDKQYEGIISFTNKKKSLKVENTEQFLLF